jgi:hypothetical protein
MGKHWRSTLAAVVAAVVVSSAAGDPARADCFELIGCTDREYMRIGDLMQLSCENLWHVRNRIYDENGYCFATWRARRVFDNSDCWVEVQEEVKLNHYERYNVERIVGAEAQKGCR